MATVLPLDGSVVKMKGLPFKVVKDEVLEFFQDFQVQENGVLMRKHPDGRPTGEAYIIFDSPEQATLAISKDREVFSRKHGERFVRVYATSESDHDDMRRIEVAGEWYTLPARAAASGKIETETIVKVKSLPFEAKQIDLINFFEGFNIRHNGVQIAVSGSFKPTGEGFVDFETTDDARRAVTEKDRAILGHKFGDRFVRLVMVSRREMLESLSSTADEGVVKVKGLPYKANINEIRQFFSGYAVKMDGISIILHPDGRPSGMAFVEFESAEEATRAMRKDRAQFGLAYGDRFVTLQLVGRQEMAGAKTTRANDMRAPVGIGGMMGIAGMAGVAGMAGMAGLGARAGMASGLGPVGGAVPPGAGPGGFGGLQGSGLPDTAALGWQAMVDPASAVVFYQNMATGERSWTDPTWNPIN